MIAMNKHETEHIIAFLDVLGASNMILSSQSESYLNLISYIFEKAAEDWPRVNNAPEIIHDIKCVTFSDNIAFALDLSLISDKDDAIKSFIKFISVFQGAALKNNILFRGGITLGQLYMDSKVNFIWGKALVDAHALEKDDAIYPRVILSHQFDHLSPQNFSRVRQDSDGLFFVDYMPIIKKLYPEWVVNVKLFSAKQHIIYKDNARIINKYDWLDQYIECCESES